MACEVITTPGGARAIVCGRPARKRCGCGQLATLECDWKVAGMDFVKSTRRRKSSGTCDAPICASCTTSPAPGKDLCPAHAREFEAWKARRQAGGQH